MIIFLMLVIYKMSKNILQDIEDEIPWNTNMEVETDLYLAA
jgi:hypothetical protein|nr:MAG TPA: hypothetical protein [Caudoviricetes sp.]